MLGGAIEIFDQAQDGTPDVFTVHGERQFTGELDLFNDRQILVSGRTGAASRVVRVRRADFRRMVTAEPDIGEIILRAFMRRVGLIRHAQGGVVLIGPSHGADTQRLQRFLTRNGYPLRLLDTDLDPDAGGFLECFGLDPAQLPVVIAPDHRVLRNPTNAALADELGLTETIDPARVYDLAVVGAGPAGLAAVYAASEGLETIVMRAWRPAAKPAPVPRSKTTWASRPGFPARRWPGARRCRRRSSAPGWRSRAWPWGWTAGPRPTDCAWTTARASPRAVVVSTGARYRKLDVPDYARFEGQGIH